jgi:2-amino-4-hydroxy-6-hydroxymethyldihydropteridine diphosphokinase
MLLIAVGANLPDADGCSPRATCERAVQALQALPDLIFVGVSLWYRSLPFPRDDRQPDYCNGVARFDGALDPAVLLAALHRIEAQFGRVRSVANAARTLDLDLIDHNGLVRADPPPVLPHPRAHLRPFVLQPIIDIAPDWVHPGFGVQAGVLLGALPELTMGSMAPW